MAEYLVSKRVLSEILGISESSLTEWQKESPPLPVVAYGGLGVDGKYDSVAVIRWMVDRALRKAQIETPRDRLARVQADMVEIQLAEKRREVIPTAEIRPAWIGFAVELSQAFRAMPANSAPLLFQMGDQDAMRALLEETVDDILTRFALNDERSATVPADGSPQADGAATAAIAVGVGGDESADAGRSADRGAVSVPGDGVPAGDSRRDGGSARKKNRRS